MNEKDKLIRLKAEIFTRRKRSILVKTDAPEQVAAKV